MPGIPVKLHFFVFQPQAAWSYLILMTLVSLLAAIYPVVLATRLPIAATLRREIVS
jgi:ABC-type lipoprotein release transport system permease subunit